jgi:hypothetical protein
MVNNKKNGLWWTPSNAEWRNTTHPVDKMMNWCTSGCWFTLAIDFFQGAFLSKYNGYVKAPNSIIAP